MVHDALLVLFIGTSAYFPTTATTIISNTVLAAQDDIRKANESGKSYVTSNRLAFSYFIQVWVIFFFYFFLIYNRNRLVAKLDRISLGRSSHYPLYTLSAIHNWLSCILLLFLLLLLSIVDLFNPLIAGWTDR